MIKLTSHLSTKLKYLVDKSKEQFSALSQSITPYHCHFCEACTDNGSWICKGCHDDLPWNHHHCKRCALPLNSQFPNLICGDCLSSPPPFDQAICAFRYELPINGAIKLLKYDQKRYFATLLTSLLADTIQTHYPNNQLPDVLIPVPIHRSKRRLRGFNQSYLIAKQLGKTLGIPVDELLLKSSPTPSQAGLNKAQRIRNLKGSFGLGRRLKPLHVALIDDVMTTQATAEILSRLLSAAGAKRVDVWCLARTAKHHQI